MRHLRFRTKSFKSLSLFFSKIACISTDILEVALGGTERERETEGISIAVAGAGAGAVVGAGAGAGAGAGMSAGVGAGLGTGSSGIPTGDALSKDISLEIRPREKRGRTDEENSEKRVVGEDVGNHSMGNHTMVQSRVRGMVDQDERTASIIFLPQSMSDFFGDTPRVLENSCPHCREASYGLMASCSRCKIEFHSSCARVVRRMQDQGQGSSSSSFMCTSCYSI